METLNDSGNTDFISDSRIQISLRTVDSFTIVINDEIVAPNSADDRYFKGILEIGDEFALVTPSKWTMYLASVPSNADTNNGVSLLQEDEPLTQYDVLAQQYEQKFKQYAEQHDLDTPEEDNDFEEIDEEYHNPLSHHEVKLMVDEHLSEQALLEKEINSSKDGTPPAETPAEKKPPTE